MKKLIPAFQLVELSDGRRFLKNKDVINSDSIYKVSNKITTVDHNKYRTVYCRHQAANQYTFAFMAILAVLIVGVPWFVAYCLGVKIKTDTYLVAEQDLFE